MLVSSDMITTQLNRWRLNDRQSVIDWFKSLKHFDAVRAGIYMFAQMTDAERSEFITVLQTL